MLAFESGAEPLVVLTKADIGKDVGRRRGRRRGGRPRRAGAGRSARRPGQGVDDVSALRRRGPHRRPAGRVRRGQVDARQRPCRRRRASASATCGPTRRDATRRRRRQLIRLGDGGLLMDTPGLAVARPVVGRRGPRPGLRRHRHAGSRSAASRTAGTSRSRGAPCGAWSIRCGSTPTGGCGPSSTPSSRSWPGPGETGSSCPRPAGSPRCRPPGPDRRAWSAGAYRATIVPSGPTRNFSKFQRMSPLWPSASAVLVSSW